ncbi:MAG TPA: adenylate/guanylate cyclase domain-containing protein [Cyanobacteria bacterium UBA11372]|nr:adenylate/guanylate cyclase domain-containing protein [Cyanobacteria bacterium UBA11372]
MKWSALKQQMWRWRVVALTAPTVAAIVIVLRLTGVFQYLAWDTFDQFFHWRPLEPPEERIVIVTIDEADLNWVRKWPISDDKIAKLLLKIKAQKPRAIGLDLYRNFPVEPGYEQLVKVFESTPNLIGIEKVSPDNRGLNISPQPILSKKGQVAANDVVVDRDDKIRRGLLFLNPPNRKAVPGFALRLAGIYLAGEGINPDSVENGDLKLGKAVFRPFESNDGDYIEADAAGYQIILNYRQPTGGFRSISLRDVLQNRMKKDLFRGRIVVIGPVASSLNDFFHTSLSGGFIQELKQMAGIEIQANIISQILSAAIEGRPLIKTWPEVIEKGWIFFWSFIGATIAGKLPNWGLSIGTLLVAGGILVGIAYLAFLGGWWIPVVPPLAALVGSASAIAAYIIRLQYQEQQKMMTLFGRYVSPQIADAIWRDRDQLLKQGRLKGQKLTATVLFTDLKNFTVIANNLDPEELMDWLNEYMEAMSEIVLAHGGVVDKFIGDAVMAVFGVPIKRTTEDAIANDAKAAVRCAQEMASALKSLNQRWLSQGRPTVAMRVGIATGTVVAGSLGGVHRLEYTTIGDCVNLAARLESFDKSMDGGICRILINQRTYRYIQGIFTTNLIGRVEIRGRQQLTTIYQVLLAKT